MTTSTRTVPHVLLSPHAFERDVPLVAGRRGEYVGSLHRGTLCVADPSGDVIVALGDPEQQVFLRSAAKPFQVMPAILSGAVDRFNISDRELAVLCASHGAEDRHTETVLGILEKGGLTEEALRCGAHPPLHERTARERAQSGMEPTPVCNNCSGAHTGMLLACRAMGWPIDSYGYAQHPLQVWIREVLAHFAQVQPEDVLFAVDNCAVPTFLLPLRRSAQAFARLATSEQVEPDLQRAAARVVRAMTAHPEMVAGEDRFDTDLMVAAAGRIVSKGGAEGFQGVGLLRQRMGIALKITDGNARAVPPAIVRALDGLSASPTDGLPERYRQPEIRNHQNERVGSLVPLFRLGEDA